MTTTDISEIVHVNHVADEPDGRCRACGSYALQGLVCESCRADGWDDNGERNYDPAWDEEDYR